MGERCGHHTRCAVGGLGWSRRRSGHLVRQSAAFAGELVSCRHACRVCMAYVLLAVAHAVLRTCCVLPCAAHHAADPGSLALPSAPQRAALPTCTPPPTSLLYRSTQDGALLHRGLLQQHASAVWCLSAGASTAATGGIEGNVRGCVRGVCVGGWVDVGGRGSAGILISVELID